MSDGVKCTRINALEKFKEAVDLLMEELPEDKGIESLSLASLERAPFGAGGHSRGGLFGGVPVREINAVGRGRRVKIGVDSGAELTVWPSDLCQDFAELVPNDASREGVCYWAPGDLEYPSIPDEGTRTFKLLIDDEHRTIAPHIAPIRKPLISVADMNDKGHDVFFPSKGQAMAVHQASGKVTRIQRTGGRFEIDAEVVPPTQCPPEGRGVDL